MSDTRTVSLTDLPVPRLCFELLRNRFTGTMTIEQPGTGVRTVWWRGGMPAFTDWVSPTDVLGEVLMASRAVDQPTLFEALQTMATKGGLLGAILVEAGAITPAVLTEALTEQAHRKLIHVFELETGTTELTPMAEIDLPNELGQVNVLRLVLRGIRRHYSETRATRDLGPALAGTMTTVDAFERYRDQFGFTPDELAIVGDLHKGSSATILHLPGVDKRGTLHMLLTLWSCQMLSVGEQADAILRARGQLAPGADESASALPPPPPSGVDPQVPPPRMVSTPPESIPPSAGIAEPLRAESEELPRHHSSRRGEKRRMRVTMNNEQPPDTSELDLDGREFVARLKEVEAKVAEDANAFELLGLELTATRKDVRGVWAKLSADFHPDTLSGRGLIHLLGRVEDVFAALSEAYSVLSNKESRENLAALVRAGGTGKTGGDTGQVVRNALEADMLARDGAKLLKAKNYTRAVEVFRRAHQLSPDDPDIKASMVYCEFCVAENPEAAAPGMIDSLRVLIEDVPNCAKAHYFLGMILKRTDATEGLVKEAFRGALKADPRLVDAQRQLRAIELQRRQSEGDAGAKKKKKGLKGFFGR